jgi:hypothetical protein
MIREGPRHHIVIEGVAATVRLGYQRAARLGAWTVDGDWFVAQIVEFDAFRITQSPLTLEIEHKDGAPTRRGLAGVTVNRGQLSARLTRLE